MLNFGYLSGRIMCNLNCIYIFYASVSTKLSIINMYRFSNMKLGKK